MANVISSDVDIMKLIKSEKYFEQPPRRESENNRNINQRFEVVANSDSEKFSVFITYSVKNPIDFSIGLIYGEYLLYRCNGLHGTTRAGFYSAPHHAYPHSHTLTMNDILYSRQKYPSLSTDLSGCYGNLFSARIFFFKFCSIIGYEKYFPVNEQMKLDLENLL